MIRPLFFRLFFGSTIFAVSLLVVFLIASGGSMKDVGMEGGEDVPTRCARGPISAIHDIDTDRITDLTLRVRKPLDGVFTAEGEPAIFIGDMQGDDKPEIVVVGDGCFNVYDTSGKMVSKCRRLPEGSVPAFLYDMDADGKLDLFFGSQSVDNLAVIVVNGCGDIIARYTIDPENSEYSAVLPQFVVSNKLYVVVRPIWADSPRGIISYRLPDFTKRWVFHLPPVPLGLAYHTPSDDERVFTISHSTTFTGSFSYLGTEDGRLKPGDTALHLFQTNENGDIINTRELTFSDDHVWERAPKRDVLTSVAPETPLIGSGEFFPYPSNRDGEGPLLLVQSVPVEEDPAAPYFFLHRIEPETEKISVTFGPVPGTFDSLRFSPNRILVLSSNTIEQTIMKKQTPEAGGDQRNNSKRGTVWQLLLLNNFIEILKAKPFISENACFGPMFRRNKDVVFFIGVGNNLLAYNQDLHRIGTWPADSPKVIRYGNDGSSHFLVAAGDSMEVWQGVFE